MEILLVIFALCLLGSLIGIGYNLWSYFEHSSSDASTPLDPNAQIIGFESEAVRYIKGEPKLKTTVTFSDGFCHISHMTSYDFTHVGLMSSSGVMHLNPFTKNAIIDDAITAHKKAVQDQQKKMEKREKKMKAKAKKYEMQLSSGELWQCASCGKLNKNQKANCSCGHTKEWSHQQQKRNA